MSNSTLLELLADDFFISKSQLDRLFVRAPHSYKQYEIKKRSGGLRSIAQPARETKMIQNWLIDNVFSRLPVHDSATAYKQGAKIKYNALRHVDKSYLMKFDFKDFFTSIKEDDLREHFSKCLGEEFKEDDIRRMARVSCIKYKHRNDKCLSIGAPSSPILSNSILFDLDRAVSSWCIENKVVYTRYADDLTFSTNKKAMSTDIESMLRESVRDFSGAALRFNNKKTISLSKKSQRKVTGIVLTNEGKLSLGRARKREVRALVHQWTLGTLDEEQVYRLQGLLGFAKDVEPSFIDKVSAKYGNDVISSLFRFRKKKQ